MKMVTHGGENAKNSKLQKVSQNSERPLKRAKKLDRNDLEINVIGLIVPNISSIEIYSN